MGLVWGLLTYTDKLDGLEYLFWIEIRKLDIYFCLFESSVDIINLVNIVFDLL